MLPRRNLEATGVVGANLRPFSLGGSVGRFAGVSNLGKPLYREKTVYSTTHKSAQGPHRRDVTHILCKVSCFVLKPFDFRRLRKR